MECYCRTIPKYQNDIRKIREAMAALQNRSECSQWTPDDTLERFSVALISQWQQELDRLETRLTEMEERDFRYHEEEAHAV